MTKQEYYNLLVQSATDGTFPSREGNVCPERDVCLYRKDFTKDCKVKCAIGILIPDDRYDPSIEGKNPSQIHRTIDLPIGMFLCDLPCIQRCHDTLSFHNGTWKASIFIREINKLLCFSNIIKANPNQFDTEGIPQ